MPLPTTNAVLLRCFVLSGSILLTSCASLQRTEEPVAVSPIIAPNLPIQKLPDDGSPNPDVTFTEGQSNKLPVIDIRSSPNLSEVLTRALSYHPKIRAAGSEHLARQAEVQQASRVPNPEFETEIENFAGNGDFSGFEGAETTIAISQRIELGNKRQQRTTEAIASSRVAAFELETKRLEVFQDTSRRFYEALAAQEELKVTNDLLRSAHRLEKAVNTRVRAGNANILEQQRVSLISSRAKITHAQAKVRRINSLKGLATVVSLPVTQIKSVSGDLFEVTQPLPEASLRAHLSSNPQAEGAAAEVARRRAALAVAQADRIPDLSLTGGARFDQESNDRAFIASVGLPLPVFNRNKGAIASAQARVNQGIFEQQAQNIELETLFGEHYSALVSAAEKTLTFQKELIPAARKNFQTTSRAYEQGKLDLVALIDAQQTLSELELETVRSATQYHVTRIKLESLVGRAVTSSHAIAQ